MGLSKETMMNIWLIRFFCSVIYIGIFAGVASAGEMSGSRILAAVDSVDGPAPCGKDGICNAAVCSKDPDCPSGMPDISHDAPLPSRKSDIEDCTTTETTEIDQAIGWGSRNWNEYEKTLEAIRGWPVDIKNCLQNRFQMNGKAVCEAKSTGECKIKSSGTANGWASSLGLSYRCHMCPTFLAKVRAISGTENRQACYFALVTHEWGHTCHRGHKTQISMTKRLSSVS
jgi:hypothetical protein